MSIKSERKKQVKAEKQLEAAKTVLQAPSKPAVPHYTREAVLSIFKHAVDPRLKLNPYDTELSLAVSDEPGQFQYDEVDGKGIIKFYSDDDSDRLIFTADLFITDEMREEFKTSKCEAPGCDCQGEYKWNELFYACACSKHSGERYGYLPRFEVCSTTECDGNHVHLIGFCEVCFDVGLAEGKDLKDASGDHLHHLVGVTEADVSKAEPAEGAAAAQPSAAA